MIKSNLPPLGVNKTCAITGHRDLPDNFDRRKLKEKLEEIIFLGFRIAEGVDEQKINQKFGINFSEKYKNILEKYISTGHLIKTDKGYRLSDEGFLVSNLILSEFI